MILVGYGRDDRVAGGGYFILRNSWGPKWGVKGYFTLPYAYLTQGSLASDFWTIRSVK